MKNSLNPGLHISEKHFITKNELTTTLQSGDLPIAATPALIIIMEQVACKLIHKRISTDFTTISAEINIKHMLKIAEGDEITCSVHLKFAEDQKLFFDFAIFNTNKDIAAIGAHERFIVKKQDFI